jgi:serpin B
VEGNLFFSPYSISVALAMTLAGARGDTETQMAQTLHLELDQARLHPALASLEARLDGVQQGGHIQLRVANALWPQEGYPFLESFLALVKRYYGVSITSLDYGKEELARETINNWAEEKTEGKVKDLIARGILGGQTLLVLTNAIYFKGDWANQFDEDLTRDAPFWTTPDAKIEVSMMAQQHRYGYWENDSLQVLELPYAGEEVSMIVLLPRRRDGFEELEGALSVETLNEWTGDLEKQKVEVFLPRFRLEYETELGKTLQSMGMRDAFGDRANFAGMDGTDSLYIFQVIHKAFVDVNEQGSEAAAATAVVMRLKSLSLAPVFLADHPFVFAIRENSTGSILFLGRVVSP